MPSIGSYFPPPKRDPLAAGESPLLLLACGAAAFLFFLSCFKCWEDLQYRLSGQRTTAQVGYVERKISHRGGSIPPGEFVVGYSYYNAVTRRMANGRTEVGFDGPARYRPGQTIEVEYRDRGQGVASSRIVGTGSIVWEWIFFGTSFMSIVLTAAVALRDRFRPDPEATASSESSSDIESISREDD